MSRLNKATREFIMLKAVEKAGIPEQEVIAINARYDWVNRVRVAANGMSDEELEALEAQHEALAAKVPESIRIGRPLVAKREFCYPNIGGMRLGYFTLAPEDAPDRMRFCAYEPTLPADHPLSAEFYELQQRDSELLERKNVIKAQVSAIVDSVATIKKLLEIWPEARELLPPNEQPVISNVPAVLITSVNAVIGLPTEEAA